MEALGRVVSRQVVVWAGVGGMVEGGREAEDVVVVDAGGWVFVK